MSIDLGRTKGVLATMMVSHILAWAETVLRWPKHRKNAVVIIDQHTGLGQIVGFVD
jgi:hypothetical protein